MFNICDDLRKLSPNFSHFSTKQSLQLNGLCQPITPPTQRPTPTNNLYTQRPMPPNNLYLSGLCQPTNPFPTVYATHKPHSSKAYATQEPLNSMAYATPIPCFMSSEACGADDCGKEQSASLSSAKHAKLMDHQSHGPIEYPICSKTSAR